MDDLDGLMITLFPGEPASEKLRAVEAIGPKVDVSSQMVKSLNENSFASKPCVFVKDAAFPYSQVLRSSDRLYIPKAGDLVVGSVTNRAGDFYKVSISCVYDALLSTMVFNNATKRNFPNIENGEFVYCIVQSASFSTDVELTCIATTDGKSWTSGDAYLGVLKDGYVVTVPPAFARSLMGDSSYVMDYIGRFIQYEVAIGMNGRIWIKAPTMGQTLAVANIILSLPQLDADRMTIAHFKALVTVFMERHIEDVED